METIGEKIYKLRKMAGISQEELGYRIGVSRQAVSQWENNSLCPKADKIKALCEEFNVHAEYFLLDESNIGVAVSDSQFNASEADNRNAEEILVKSSHSDNISKALFIIIPVILVIVIVASIIFILLLSHEQRGDYSTASIVFGMRKSVLIVLISLFTILLVGIGIYCLIRFQKRNINK